jgi:hypothetical protein
LRFFSGNENSNSLQKYLSVIFLLAFDDFLGVRSYRGPVEYFSVRRMDEGEVSPLSSLAVLHIR